MNEVEQLSTPEGRHAYALESLRQVNLLWDYIPFHLIRWWRGYREVGRRNALLRSVLNK